MTPDLILFLFLAVVAVASAAAMLMARNPVYSAIFLILNFSTIAVFYLLLEAPFIAMAQITVYAGAIMVLFLFVIMLLGGEELKTQETLSWQQPVAIGLGAVLLGEVIYVLFFRSSVVATAVSGTPGAVPDGFGGPEAVGLLMFSEYLLPFEITSVLLLIGMIGAIALTQFEKKRRKA